MEKITRPTTGVENILQVTFLHVVSWSVILYEINHVSQGKKTGDVQIETFSKIYILGDSS